MEKQLLKSWKKGNKLVTSKEKKRMKINKELIHRCSSKNLLPIQQSDGLMDRITHLYLQEQHIKKIENLDTCRNLRALYLYDNKIETIENLEDLVHLTFLYLHKNAISCIENMDTLSQLTVLNLSHNCISRLEGLNSLLELRELYLQYQNLPEGQSFEFDPGTITCIGESLRVLNVSGNRLKSFMPLRPLEHLEHFTAEENEVCDLQEVVDVFENWKYARIVKISGNPVCALRKYRDNVVVSCLELEELDGKVVSQPYRNFLLNWKQCQTLQSRKKESYAVLKPFLEAQIKNKQLSPPRNPRSSSVAPKPDRSGSSASSSQSETSVSSKNRSKSAQRTRSLQEVPLKLMKKLTKNR
ncbi:protein phosphatase 1 regulatory subunit 42 [Caerostris darwini]|uniref:Protein phosphatase 1 regulatory subunit 42 n=1 Tax=Caerostris darwini TaxID=1538125 RepID=A0AAV4NTL2_9ARAC|nr:protein phosphatase 1 regulatory subunit 42 [Caerostris darwini]